MKPCVRPAAGTLVLGAMLVILAGTAWAAKGITDGTFQDRAGARHAWSVERSHLLVWAGKPYVPAGVVFHSAYLRSPSPETLLRDTAELDRLKTAGVLDIWIDPGRGLLESGVEHTQTLIDAAESRGFRYGLRVGDRSREPLIGFSPTVAPVRIPAARLQPGTQGTWTVAAPRGRRALYTLVDSSDDGKSQNWAIAMGEVVVERDSARVEIQIQNSKLLGRTRGVLLVIPEIQVEPEELGSFGDLWGGMEDYSKRLRSYLKAVKFGAGLRFLLDPFSAGDGTLGQEDLVFPSSAAFRSAFQEWLQRRSGFQTLNLHWRTTDRQIPGIEEAARLVPSWPRHDPPEGDGWLLDPVDNVAYRCIPAQSRIWDDLETFRADALKRWMNQTSTLLKQDGPDVPVLYSWASYHPIFNNSPSPDGYDGLGAQLFSEPSSVATDAAAYALAQAEESDRNAWLVATRLAGPPDASGTPAPLKGGADLRRAWEEIQSAGFRGVYLDPEQCPDAAAAARELAAVVAPESAAQREPPRVCFFPLPLAVADRVTRLSNGVWWLPSRLPARLLSYGDHILGYQIERPFGDEHVVQAGAVLWSTAGKRDYTFFFDKLARVELYDSAGKPLKVKTRRNELRMTLTEEPIVATGLNVSTIFPLELATVQLREFDELLKRAEAQKLDVAAMRAMYAESSRVLSANSAAVIFNAIQPYINSLRGILSPYHWLEGERSVSQNLSGAVFQTGCSMGTYLKLDRKEPAISGIYRSRYHVQIGRTGSYEIWLAGRVPGRPGVSPLVWQIDEEPAVEVKAATPAGADYSPRMAWFPLGRVTLTPGRHELTLVVPQRAENGRFSAGFDAIVFAGEPFQPDGIRKPYGKPVVPLDPKGAGESRKKRDR